MSEIILAAEQAITDPGLYVSSNMYERFCAYLDASPKTVETYTKALRQMALYFSDNGITQPSREDIVNYREALKASGKKPTTVQNNQNM